MTGIRDIENAPAMSAAPEHVRLSVVGGRTQLDVTLPVDVPVATLVPELVKLVRSRDVEASSDTPWAATRDMYWVLSRLDPLAPLQPNETLRAAGVVDGELLRLTDERALTAPTLYDDVVDATARLNKAAYVGWNAAAARWMSFVGLAAASLVWVYLVGVTSPARHTLVMALATVVATTMVGVAMLAHRSYGRADIGAVVGWCTIAIYAAVVWALVRGIAGFYPAAGCGLLVLLNAACYRAIGTGRWGYLASTVLFATGGFAMLGRSLGVSAQTVGVVVAVVGALGCLVVSTLVRVMVRDEPVANKPDQEAVSFETPFAPQPSATDAATHGPSFAAMPTAEAVWARVRAAAVTRSALYAGLAASVLCAVAAVLRAESGVRWAALVFAGVCAAALGVYARRARSALERASLWVPAAALVVVGCLSAQGGSAAMAWVGFGTLLAVAAVAPAAGLRLAAPSRRQRWASAWAAYLQYAAHAALIPVAMWVGGVYAQLVIR